ncbi:PREDICTED: chitotriosidase-1-like isoform X2 [Camelina sativa]|uniref:Chitotriosidase-1-like isoform X2 n=1 Tax=Camelina sativa TaxID=90675 RepID=A0ABM0U196_CAMSA|nr:PREDICTED: chitotriosidase-1-like isoform X2 [Camelina sativa]
MSSTKLIIYITFFLSLLLRSSSAQDIVKATYWFPKSEFPVADIDSSLFTHLFCAFADLNPQTNEVTISSTNQPKFSTFTQTVRERNPSVKTLLSIGGGGNESISAAFASMASNPNSRKTFIDSSITLARSNGFNGLDLDWEYPKTETEMNNFGTLLQEWRSAATAEASSSGSPPLLLTAAVFYSSDHYSAIYPVQVVANSLDWVNLMAYDFFYRSDSSSITGPPAALYDPSNTGPSGDAGVSTWIQAGLPTKKAVLGFPFYGYAWSLSNANANSYYDATTGPAILPGMPEAGAITYGLIKKFIIDNGVTPVNNATVVGDYCYAGTTWIGYDDSQSIVTKVRYAKEKGLLGYFSWHVGADDNSELARAASQA